MLQVPQRMSDPTLDSMNFLNEVVERGAEVRLLVPRARLGELARNLR